MDRQQSEQAASPRPAQLRPRGESCCGLAVALLLHGLGAHPASQVALRGALRAISGSERCVECMGWQADAPAALPADAAVVDAP